VKGSDLYRPIDSYKGRKEKGREFSSSFVATIEAHSKSIFRGREIASLEKCGETPRAGANNHGGMIDGTSSASCGLH